MLVLNGQYIPAEDDSKSSCVSVLINDHVLLCPVGQLLLSHQDVSSLV